MYKGLKVGIITANYNNQKYFEEYIGGLLGQSVRPDVIAYVDDCSKEEFKPDVEKLGIPFVFAKLAKNSGPATARNIAIRELVSNGCNILGVCDSDDVYYPEKIKESLDVFVKHPEIGLVYSDYDTYNEATGEVKREFKFPYSYERLSYECIVSNNSFYRSDIIKTVGLYDESLFGPEDYDLWLRISEVAPVYHIGKSLYKYRISGNNITVTTPIERFAEHVRKVHQKAAERRGRNV
jgi:GT2 family glycosyltransferase